MSTALAVLLFVLKCIGILLLIVLALLIIVLLTPVGVDLLCEPVRYTVHARFGPFRYLLMPREEKEKTSNPRKSKTKLKDKKKENPADADKKQEKQNREAPAARRTTDEHTAQIKPKPDTEQANQEKAVAAKQEPQQEQKRATPQKPKQEPEQEGSGLMDDIKDSLTSIMNELRGDPFGTIQHLLDEFTPLLGRLLHGVHIRHLRVLWTITGEDAAQTAIAYGRAITLSNIVLERVQELMDVKADSLRLEPDFANQMAEMRHLSCQITVRPCIILIIGIKLLWRFLQLRKKQGKKK